MSGVLQWGESPPWQHQRECAEWLLEQGSGYIAFEMGGGKSYVAIVTMNAWGAKRILILCPKSVIGVWRREYGRHSSRKFAVLGLDKSSQSSAAKASTVRGFLRTVDRDAVAVVVVNYESAYRGPLGDELLAAGFDCVTLDESHRIKSPGGKASKFAAKIGKKAKHRLCLSGTPAPHSPLDIWAQMRFLEPTLFGRSFARFRARYATTHPQFPSKVLRWENQDELREKLAPWMRRVRTADVVDMPEVLHERVEVELSPQSKRAYTEIEDYLSTVVDGEEIEARNVLSKLLRQQQITSGEMTIEGRRFQFGTEKRDALIDRLGDIHRLTPVVVFYRFASDLRAIEYAAEKTGRRFGQVSGATKDLTEHSTMPEGIDLLAVQESAGGVGIDLTRAHIGFWFSLSYSLGDYDQANARMHRPGQQSNVALYHLVARGTIDEAIYQALERRRNVVDAIIEQLHLSRETV